MTGGEMMSAVEEIREQHLRRIEELERENVRLKSLLLNDELTGLYNKRFFLLQLEVETTRTRRTGQPCALLVMELDNFKALHETVGREAIARVVIQVGGIIWKNIRPTDFACRLDAGVFAVIMPAVNLTDGMDTARRVQRSLARPETLACPDFGKRLSGSFGIAVYEAHSPLSVDEFFARAEREKDAAQKACPNGIGCAQGPDKAAVSPAEKDALAQTF